MQPSPGAPSAAQCALHPDQSATEVCARCGNFMCAECSRSGQEPQCPSCRELTSVGEFPFTRGDFSFSQLFDYAFETFKRDWLMICLAVVVVFAVSLLATGVSSVLNQIVLAVLGLQVDSANPMANLTGFAVSTGLSMTLGSAINMVVQGFVMMGLYRVLIDALDGRKVDLARLFTQARKLGRYIVLNIILMTATYLPIVAVFGLVAGGAIVGSGLSFGELDTETIQQVFGPGVIVALAVALLVLLAYIVWLMPLWLFSVPELVVSEASPVEALQRAWQLAPGLRLATFGYSFVAGLITMVGLLLCCVGVVPAMGLASLLSLSLFLAARGDPAFPARTRD